MTEITSMVVTREESEDPPCSPPSTPRASMKGADMLPGRSSHPAQAPTGRHPLAGLGLILALVILAPACSKSDDPPDRGSSFWSSFRISGALEVEDYGSLREMADSADSVVLGSFTGFEMSRTLQGDAQEDVVNYGEATLAISTVLAGKPYGETVALEFLIPATTTADAERIVAELRGDLPTGEMVVFLRDKGGSESGFFRVTNSVGLWAATGRSALDTPLAEESPKDSRLYEDELKGADSISELADLIISYTD